MIGGAQMTDPTHATDRPTALLVLADGTVFEGVGFGREGSAVGELCFNTSMTGYQEILTDPSYAGQLITFTAPHIGNVGTNGDDMEFDRAAARGMVVRELPTTPANFRAEMSLDHWADETGVIGISGLDTRALTRLIRAQGAPNAVVAYSRDGAFDLAALKYEAANWPGLKGMDLAMAVTRSSAEPWAEGDWHIGHGFSQLGDEGPLVVALDYGAKRNILRRLVSEGLRVTVVPANTPFADIMALKPQGFFLANGPGDPAATGAYALPVIQDMIKTGLPIFGICLGHQLLGLAFGGKTFKMQQGHRGANHPVQDLRSGKVEITSMNHGFAVSEDGLPDDVDVMQKSLFDGTVCGLRHKSLPIFSVQQHPEASPGPTDSYYLFKEFAEMVTAHA